MTDTLAPPTPGAAFHADRWAINWRGNRWTSDELTGAHLGVISELLGGPVDWSIIDVRAMHPVLGPLQTMALIASFTIVDEHVHGRAAMVAVLDLVKQATAAELLEAIELPEG